MPQAKVSKKSQPLSQEFIYDSDDSGAQETRPVPTKVSSKKQKNASPKKPKRRKITPPTKTPTPPPAQSSSESEEDDDDEVASASASSSTGEGRDGATDDRQPNQSKTGRQESAVRPTEKVSRPRAAALVKEVQSRPFRPPRNFQETALELDPVVSQILSDGKSGKQVWHVTAPASLSMSSLKELDLNAIKSGSSTLLVDNEKYTFSAAGSHAHHLLIPESTGNSYKQSQSAVSRSFQIREIPKLAHSTEVLGSQPTKEPEFFATTKPPRKPAPKQPANLKMRYRPFGLPDSPPLVADDIEMVSMSKEAPRPTSSSLDPERTARKKKKRDRSKGLPDAEPSKSSQALELPSPLPSRETKHQSVNENQEDSAVKKKKKKRRRESQE